MTVQEMNEPEVLAPELHVERPETVAPDFHEEMATSIARNLLIGPDKPRIPLVEIGHLEAGNKKVEQRLGSSARRLAILGADVVSFDDQPASRFKTQNAAQLLSLLIFERRVSKPTRYLELGFGNSVRTSPELRTTLSSTVTGLDRITDRSGKPLVHRCVVTKGGTYGIDDVVVTDVRHTLIYQGELQKQSTDAFVKYILEGGVRPNMLEKASIRGAKAALRLSFETGLKKAQTERFVSVSKQAAAMIDHRSLMMTGADIGGDEVRQRRFLREIIADALEPRWQQQAACNHRAISKLFFPPTTTFELKREKAEREDRAKAVCYDCPVRSECLNDALSNNEFDGVWGGFTEKERKAFRKQGITPSI